MTQHDPDDPDNLDAVNDLDDLDSRVMPTADTGNTEPPEERRSSGGLRSPVPGLTLFGINLLLAATLAASLLWPAAFGLQQPAQPGHRAPRVSPTATSVVPIGGLPDNASTPLPTGAATPRPTAPTQATQPADATATPLASAPTPTPTTPTQAPTPTDTPAPPKPTATRSPGG